MTVDQRVDSSALDELFWRSEILQALYWMRGEGLAADVAPGALAEFLGAEAASIHHHVRLLVNDGYLEPAAPGRYQLTALGLSEGGRSFHDEFAELTRRAHGECGPGCWCQDPNHAGEPCPNHPEPPPQPPEKPDDGD